MNKQPKEWRDNTIKNESTGYFTDYDIVAVPNDFNVSVIVSWIEKGEIVIPGFQRNYVWDIKRASRLIESLLLGLPVPQVFLYEQESGPLLLLDGQQRLMTLQYFTKGRFPRKSMRAKLRNRIDQNNGVLSAADLQDDALFVDFKLSLKSPDGEESGRSRFHGLKYQTLGEAKRTLDLRTIRNVVIKQIRPSDDHSSMFEVFNRLNSGGVNVTAQELRASLYQSDFMDRLMILNRDKRFRNLIARPEADDRFADVEVLLRSFAFAEWPKEYAAPMLRFLNRYAKHCQSHDEQHIDRLSSLFGDFLDACENVSPEAFQTEKGRFNLALFEMVFGALVGLWLEDPSLRRPRLSNDDVRAIAADSAFAAALQEGTTKKKHVDTRRTRATALLSASN